MIKMKLIKLTAISCIGLVLASCNTAPKALTTADLKDITDSASYLYGIGTAESLKNDSNINKEVFLAALREALDKDSGFAISMDQYQAIDQQFRAVMKSKQDEEAANVNKAGAETFLAQIAQKPGIQKLNGGILIEVLKEGAGPNPTLRDSAQFHLLYSTNNTPNIVNTKDQSQYPFPMMGIMDMNFLANLPDAMLSMQEGGEYIVYMPYASAKSFFTDQRSKPGEVSIIKITDLKFKMSQ
jgi:hypothetical protein